MNDYKPTPMLKGQMESIPPEEPRCQFVTQTPWGPAQCALPASHEPEVERHAYSPSEALEGGS